MVRSLGAGWFLWFLGCPVLQFVLDRDGLPNWSDPVVVLVQANSAPEKGVYYRGAVQVHEAPSIYELFRFDLVYTRDDFRSRHTYRGLDCLHLPRKLLQRPPTLEIYRRALLFVWQKDRRASGDRFWLLEIFSLGSNRGFLRNHGG